MRVVVAGATGFIGSALVRALLDRGDEVTALTRNATRARRILGPSVDVQVWHPPRPGPWAQSIVGTGGVVNLTGERVVEPHKPWTRGKKRRILTSRVEPTEALVAAIEGAVPRPPVLINASAIGYYGSRGDTPLTEDSGSGSDFLAGVVRRWEAAARRVQETSVRLVLLRSGNVLGRGAELDYLTLPFRYFAGGTIGRPEQWFSWIHLQDEVALILFALDHAEVPGPVNAVSPQPVTMRTFSGQIGAALHRPVWVPFVDKMLPLALGQRAQVLLSSQKVLPEAAQAAGFQFRHPDSGEALRDIL